MYNVPVSACHSVENLKVDDVLYEWRLVAVSKNIYSNGSKLM